MSPRNPALLFPYFLKYHTQNLRIRIMHKLHIFTLRQHFPLSNLPPELILCVATHLDISDTSALSRTCKRLHTLLMPAIFHRAVSITRPGTPTPFQWVPSPGRSILHFSAAHGNIALLTNIIARLGPQTDILNARDQDGITPLVSAVVCGHAEIMCALLNAGAEVDRTIKYHGWTALHVAAMAGDSDLARLLIEAGAETERRDTLCGLTPLHLVVLRKYPLEMWGGGILERGCESGAIDAAGFSVNHSERLMMFIRDGAWDPPKALTGFTAAEWRERNVLGSKVKSRHNLLVVGEMDRCRWCARGQPWVKMTTASTMQYRAEREVLGRKSRSKKDRKKCQEVVSKRALRRVTELRV